MAAMAGGAQRRALRALLNHSGAPRSYSTAPTPSAPPPPPATSASDPTSAQPARKKRVVFSGIQPTGVPHIGNHLGALAQWQRLVKEVAAQPEESRDELYFSVVGMHALTVPQDPVRLRQERRDMFAVLLALGLTDPKTGAAVFHQDQVLEHGELAWYLNTVTPVNRLMRMTTWKSKLVTLRNAKSEDEIDDSMLQLGLLAYPVLQAADILLYKTTHVPVGHDQSQHLELCRDIAQVFNRAYPGRRRDGKGKGKGPFRMPEVMLTTHPRIQSLRNPLQKMSKSAPSEASKIYLTDSPEAIHSKIKTAVTDSIQGVTWDPENRPGIATLLQIYEGYSGEPVEDIAKRYTGQRGIMEMKADLAECVSEGLRGFREEFARIRTEEAYLREKEREGADKARATASRTMEDVRAAIGLD
ncbi:Tryptophanyl-tRNA synthetase [Rhodotorula toruloides ATCC 204091]|uniref:tryptophan--tRNA ligase n=2 Tax=Rhodotorula toruloides TaxID=5286 RepID=A0A0K3CI14_RHOTO|nr:Tryptophanyl-tRNA synthetase [Rhodotorula toruloides ATCC 204091]KAK4332720.1 Tryptophan--tRNA ligase, mitochondrial [Rhodotorula toruloides]